MTHFGQYFKLLEHLDGSPDSVSDSATRLRELGYIVRHDERLEPWQRTVLLEQLFLLQRSQVTPKLAHEA